MCPSFVAGPEGWLDATCCLIQQGIHRGTGERKAGQRPRSVCLGLYLWLRLCNNTNPNTRSTVFEPSKHPPLSCTLLTPESRFSHCSTRPQSRPGKIHRLTTRMYFHFLAFICVLGACFFLHLRVLGLRTKSHKQRDQPPQEAIDCMCANHLVNKQRMLAPIVATSSKRALSSGRWALFFCVFENRSSRTNPLGFCAAPWLRQVTFGLYRPPGDTRFRFVDGRTWWRRHCRHEVDQPVATPV